MSNAIIRHKIVKTYQLVRLDLQPCLHSYNVIYTTYTYIKDVKVTQILTFN